MKNSITIRREFGEVIIEACLPSVEEFIKKMSSGKTENILMTHIPSERHKSFYCADLANVYSFEPESSLSEFYEIVEKEKLLYFQWSWGQTHLCTVENINIVPFFSKGIGSPKTLKFTGMYSTESLEKVIKTLKRLVEYIKGHRQPLELKFDIEVSDDEKPILIKL